MSKYKNKKYGIYRSGLEKNCADLLKQNNIYFEYEPWEVLLLDSFVCDLEVFEKSRKKYTKRNQSKLRKITYTPDFVGENWIIETKGRKTADFMLKWKLFKKYLMDNNLKYTLFMPTNTKEILESIKYIKEYENRI